MRFKVAEKKLMDRKAAELLGGSSNPPSPKRHHAETSSATAGNQTSMTIGLGNPPRPTNAAPLRPTNAAMPPDNWKECEIWWHRDNMWWTWDTGICDARKEWPLKSCNSEGTQYRISCKRIRNILYRRDCEFKVGMTTNLGVRWEAYTGTVGGWHPSHMFIIHDVIGRAAAGFLEAALIGMLSRLDLPACNNINFNRGDFGGTGQRKPELLDAKYYMYLVVLPTVQRWPRCHIK